eukprot:213718-Amphidinium_carterae.1
MGQVSATLRFPTLACGAREYNTQHGLTGTACEPAAQQWARRKGKKTTFRGICSMLGATTLKRRLYGLEPAFQQVQTSGTS